MLLRSGRNKVKSDPEKTESIEIVDSEISFHFNVRNKETKQENMDWLKTMVIIYQDLFYFDIKKEPKEDYEAEAYEPKMKKKKKRRRKKFF